MINTGEKANPPITVPPHLIPELTNLDEALNGYWGGEAKKGSIPTENPQPVEHQGVIGKPDKKNEVDNMEL